MVVFLILTLLSWYIIGSLWTLILLKIVYFNDKIKVKHIVVLFTFGGIWGVITFLTCIYYIVEDKKWLDK